MNTLQFIASLVGSLAWPAAACAILIVLRHPLAEMLKRGRLKKLKAGPSGVEVEYFDEKLEEARNELAGAPTPAEAPTSRAELSIVLVPDQRDGATRDDFMDEMRQLANVAPSAVILESFARLEKVLRTAVETDTRGGRSEFDRPVSIRSLTRRALEQKLVTPPEVAALEDVAVLRNLVAHGGNTDIDAERALSYATIVHQLIVSILSAHDKTSDGDSPG